MSKVYPSRISTEEEYTLIFRNKVDKIFDKAEELKILPTLNECFNQLDPQHFSSVVEALSPEDEVNENKLIFFIKFSSILASVDTFATYSRLTDKALNTIDKISPYTLTRLVQDASINNWVEVVKLIDDNESGIFKITSDTSANDIKSIIINHSKSQIFTLEDAAIQFGGAATADHSDHGCCILS